MKNPRYSNFGHRWRNFPLWLKFSCSLPNYVTGERNFRSPVIEIIFLQFQHYGLLQIRSAMSEISDTGDRILTEVFSCIFVPLRAKIHGFFDPEHLAFHDLQGFELRLTSIYSNHLKWLKTHQKLAKTLVESMLETWVCFLGY